LDQDSGLIHYRCTAPSHQHSVEGRTADTLTVHEGKWSYCPMDIRANDHQWQPTGGVRIELLRRSYPRISLDLDIRPHLGTKAPSTTVGLAAGSSNGGTARKLTTKR